MKRNKYWLIAVAILFLTWKMASGYESGLFSNLYRGLDFNSLIIYYAEQIALYFCYSLIIFDCFKEYLEQYAIFLVIRSKKRVHLLYHCCGVLLLHLLLVEAMKIVFFVGINWMKYHRFAFDFVLPMAEYMLGMSVFLMFQMLMEMMMASAVALLISAGMFIVNLAMSDMFFSNGQLEMAKWMPTTGMFLERKIHFQNPGFSHMQYCLLMLLLLVVMWVIAYFYLRKKDFC